MGVTVAIPTFGRERVLLETVAAMLLEGPDELIVVDQTQEHEPETVAQLSEWESRGEIRWLRLEEANIPAAMNRALVEATQDLVLFVDDDILPGEGLLGAHAMAHAEWEDVLAVVGQILQPGEEPVSPPASERFCFHSTEPGWPRTAMGGNLSVKRLAVVRMGGFDENFIGAAFYFEREFAERVWESGQRIRYDPGASIRHLRVPSGGTRAHGSHLMSASPRHSVGAYYFLLLRRRGWGLVQEIRVRLVKSLVNWHHVKGPWWIPVTVVAELRGFLLALRLWRAGPKLLRGQLD